MKKVILKVQVCDQKAKIKAMKAVSALQGIDSISMDKDKDKDKTMTVIGDIDPVDIVSKLRKLYRTEIVSVGPAKEPKKKEEPKKEEPKIDEKKKDDVA